ncbi:Pr6Pr family membrane protein [Cellulomonas sp. FA1]|uniref:Pr6Pr family membrane protein n=1 Tax=Cellulomonas sp. FA1 TaxID=1346710 RepID=UPI0006253060|nr:Pr6Pr family membrane protein [Cellulomonas sp. FA1]
MTDRAAAGARGVGTGAARVLHALVAVCALVGVGLEVGRALTSPDGDLVRLFSYFTIWSNVLVLGVSALLAVRPRHDGPWFRALRLDSVLFIVVTFAIYHALLSGYAPITAAGQAANLLLHTVVPVGAVLAWLVAGPRPRVRLVTCATALVLPAVWLVYTFVHGAATGWYPYPFLDASVLGTGRALLAALAVMVGGALLGPALWALERRLPPAPR